MARYKMEIQDNLRKLRTEVGYGADFMWTTQTENTEGLLDGGSTASL